MKDTTKNLNEQDYNSTSEELRDVLIAISVVAKRLARRYEQTGHETECETNKTNHETNRS